MQNNLPRTFESMTHEELEQAVKAALKPIVGDDAGLALIIGKPEPEKGGSRCIVISSIATVQLPLLFQTMADKIRARIAGDTNN